MVKRRLAFALATCAVLVGCSLPRAETDIFALLPEDALGVEGLRIYQQEFSGSSELMLSISAVDASQALEAASEISSNLVEQGLAESVIWRNPLDEDPEAIGELAAFLWVNGASSKRSAPLLLSPPS